MPAGSGRPRRRDRVDPLQRTLADLLLAHRDRASLSQDELARRINFSRGAVAGVESCHRIMSEQFWTVCDKELDAGGRLLAAFDQLDRARIKHRRQQQGVNVAQALDHVSPSSGADTVSSARPEMPAALGVPVGERADVPAASLTPETLSAEVEHTTSDLSASMADILLHYAQMDNLVGPRKLIPAVMAQLELVEQLIAGARGQTRVGLFEVAAQYAEFTGWLYQDSGDLRRGMFWTDRALEFGYAAAAPRLISYILMRKSNHLSEMRQALSTVGLAKAALTESAQLPSPRLRALALRQVARGHAMDGNAIGAHRALDEARSCVAVSDDFGRDEQRLTGYCTAEFIELEAADCYTRLGRHHDAVLIFENVLATWPDQYRRDRAVHLARLATAYAAGREIERARALALEAAALGQQTGSVRAITELRRLEHVISLPREALAGPASDPTPIGQPPPSTQAGNVIPHGSTDDHRDGN